jgi:hypothetical protein
MIKLILLNANMTLYFYYALLFQERVSLIVPWIVGLITFMALEAVAIVYSNVLRDHVNKVSCKRRTVYYIQTHGTMDIHLCHIITSKAISYGITRVLCVLGYNILCINLTLKYFYL